MFSVTDGDPGDVCVLDLTKRVSCNDSTPIGITSYGALEYVT